MPSPIQTVGAVVLAPEGDGGVLDRRRGGQAGVCDQDIETAELHRGFVETGLDLNLVGDVADQDADLVAAVGLGRLLQGLAQGCGIPIGQHHAGALREQPARYRAPDAARRSGHQGDSAFQGLGLGHALLLGFLQRPVFDGEGLGLFQR